MHPPVYSHSQGGPHRLHHPVRSHRHHHRFSGLLLLDPDRFFNGILIIGTHNPFDVLLLNPLPVRGDLDAGLGVIWKQGNIPTGLTTAAAIWVTAALGVLIGLGLWTEVAAGTILTIFIVYSKILLKRMGLED